MDNQADNHAKEVAGPRTESWFIARHFLSRLGLDTSHPVFGPLTCLSPVVATFMGGVGLSLDYRWYSGWHQFLLWLALVVGFIGIVMIGVRVLEVRTRPGGPIAPRLTGFWTIQNRESGGGEEGSNSGGTTGLSLEHILDDKEVDRVIGKVWSPWSQAAIRLVAMLLLALLAFSLAALTNPPAPNSCVDRGIVRALPKPYDPDNTSNPLVDRHEADIPLPPLEGPCAEVVEWLLVVDLIDDIDLIKVEMMARSTPSRFATASHIDDLPGPITIGGREPEFDSDTGEAILVVRADELPYDELPMVIRRLDSDPTERSEALSFSVSLASEEVNLRYTWLPSTGAPFY